MGRLTVRAAIVALVLLVVSAASASAGEQRHPLAVIVYGLDRSSDRTGGSSSETLWIERLDGGDRHLLGIGVQPKISADGTLVGSATEPTNGTRVTVTVYRTNGSLMWRWTERGYDGSPVGFSPDNHYFAVDINQGSVYDLRVYDLRTGRCTLTLGGDWQRHPSFRSQAFQSASFSPTPPDRIVYSAGGSDGSLTLEVRLADGAGSAGVLPGTRGATFPVWGPAGIAFDAPISPRATAEGFDRVSLWRRPGDISIISERQEDRGFPVTWSANGEVLALNFGTWALGSQRVASTPFVISAISHDGRSILTVPQGDSGPEGTVPTAARLRRIGGGPARPVTPPGVDGVDSNF